MQKFEYRVIAAPGEGNSMRAPDGAGARFPEALEEVMNRMAQDGWEYQRAETLPQSERTGFAGTTTRWRSVLVFRRRLDTDAPASRMSPDVLQLEDPVVPATPPRAAIPPIIPPMTPEDDASQSAGASRMLQDNGVEELSEVSGISSSLRQLASNRNVNKTAD